MKLVVGLGNPGERYKNTPHNLGFLVVDRLAEIYKVYFKKKRSFEIGEFRLGREKVFLIKPLTYMNLSGIGLVEFLKKRSLDFKNMLVVCDDISLPFGKLRLKIKGSDGGHLGLRSVIKELKTQEFPRLRIGIGKPRVEDLVKYVLEIFPEEEKEKINKMIENASEAVLTFLREGAERTMNKFN